MTHQLICFGLSGTYWLRMAPTCLRTVQVQSLAFSPRLIGYSWLCFKWMPPFSFHRPFRSLYRWTNFRFRHVFSRANLCLAAWPNKHTNQPILWDLNVGAFGTHKFCWFYVTFNQSWFSLRFEKETSRPLSDLYGLWYSSTCCPNSRRYGAVVYKVTLFLSWPCWAQIN